MRKKRGNFTVNKEGEIGVTLRVLKYDSKVGTEGRFLSPYSNSLFSFSISPLPERWIHGVGSIRLPSVRGK